MLTELFNAIPEITEHHAPGSPVHAFLREVAVEEVVRPFREADDRPREFGPFGPLSFPCHKMGAIDSANLFEVDELIAFSFYWVNRHRYANVLDIGANVGLHSIILCRCGYRVRAYEPDPEHFRILRRNLELNGCSSVEAINAAVSVAAGTQEFVRVLGNTTSSHLAGSKTNPYGELERFPVRVEAVRALLAGVDFVKLDVEGHEKDILLATTTDDWKSTDALVEVGGGENASAIHDHFRACGVNLFAQKIGWGRVRDRSEMPESYRDGLLFISPRDSMPWRGPVARNSGRAELNP